MKKITGYRVQWIVVMFLLFTITCPLSTAFAGPSSTHYQLINYGFGSGGTDNSSSSNYQLYGVLGELESGKTSSSNYGLGGGLVYTLQANTPASPTFSNPGSIYYDRLQLILNIGTDASDTLYAVAISSDNFSSDNEYIQSNYTPTTNSSNQAWLPYSGVSSWGGSSGVFITNLKNNTTYTVKVKAKKGGFTQSGYGPTSSAATLDPSLTFSISSPSLTFNNLNSGNSFTDSTQTTTLTITTNAQSGYSVYGRETGALTGIVTSDTISDYSSPNSAPTSWSGIGFGYSTDDLSLAGGTSNRFSGPKYAGFSTSSPGDPVADNPGPPASNTAISDTANISYRVTATSTTKPDTYKTTIIYNVVASY